LGRATSADHHEDNGQKAHDKLNGFDFRSLRWNGPELLIFGLKEDVPSAHGTIKVITRGSTLTRNW
nr:hypothetical protein [Polyangiaceae bacterium]